MQMPGMLGCQLKSVLGLAVLLGVWQQGNRSNLAEAQGRSPTLENQAAQSNPGDRAPDGNRITINVVVADKLGHHVDGLQASDFTLLDNNEPQKLIGLRAIDDKNAADDPVQIVIVVDDINARFSEVAWERQQLDAFLKQDGGKLAFPTTIAILADGGVQMLPGTTQDGMGLMALFDKSQTALRTVTRAEGFYGAAEKIGMSLDQLDQLIGYEARQPGRKLLLVLSGGWPLLPAASNFEDTNQENQVFNSVVHLTNEVLAGRVALYCLYPYMLGIRNPYYYQSYLKPIVSANHAVYPDLALQVLAEHSGGQVVMNGKDITGDLSLAVRDASASYELTFAASGGDRPNEYHALHVEVDRPDVKVRTNAGYYARPQRAGAKKH